MSSVMKIGYNTFDSLFKTGSKRFDYPAKQGAGVDFLFCHMNPESQTLADDCKTAGAIARAAKELGVELIANFELNFSRDTKGPDGLDWANRPDGTHRLKLYKEYVDALISQGNLTGVAYDEFEHCILNGNISLSLTEGKYVDAPVFPVPDTNELTAAASVLDSQLAEYLAEMKELGVPALAGEAVFPALFHAFARNGIIPNFKSQKEGYSNIHWACAAGAALQYGTELWNCVDMWHKMTYPGHSAEEMYQNLVFAYLAGVDRVYPESVSVFFDSDDNYNEIGRAFTKFSDEYRGRDRGYTVRDYEPEIGIIRTEDGFWGQDGIQIGWRGWQNKLLNNPRMKGGKKNNEWIDAFETVTRGETRLTGISWDRISAWSVLIPHRSFCTMNGAAVFDEFVRKDTLKTLNVAFLCGEFISGATLRDVDELVRENGLIAVTSPRFAPEEVLSQVSGKYGEIRRGEGKYIITDDFASPKLKKSLDITLGNKGEIALKFKGKKIRLKVDPDGNGFRQV